MLVLDANLPLASRPDELTSSQVYLYELWFGYSLTGPQKDSMKNNLTISPLDDNETRTRKLKTLRELYVTSQTNNRD